MKVALILSQVPPDFLAESNLWKEESRLGFMATSHLYLKWNRRCLTSTNLTLTALWRRALGTQLTAACVATVCSSRRNRWNDSDTRCFYRMRPSGKQPVDNICEEDSVREKGEGEKLSQGVRVQRSLQVFSSFHEQFTAAKSAFCSYYSNQLIRQHSAKSKQESWGLESRPGPLCVLLVSSWVPSISFFFLLQFKLCMSAW